MDRWNQVNRFSLAPVLLLVIAGGCAPVPTPIDVEPSPLELSPPLRIPPPQRGDTLRYDGIYHRREVESPYPGVWSYLRFYPDSMVVYMTTPGEPHRIGNLTLGNSILPYGIVTVRDNRLAFSVREVSVEARLDFRGYVSGDRLFLQRHPDYNAHGVERVYVFLQMSAADTARLGPE